MEPLMKGTRGLTTLLPLLWGYSSFAGAQAPVLLRDPSLSLTQVAFSYGGYIWTARRDGSGVKQLTTGRRGKQARIFPRWFTNCLQRQF